jgi:hypothetical protein
MSFETFCKLKRGDVVLFNGTPRVVQSGPLDDPRQRQPHERGRYVEFVKMRNSIHRENPLAVYLYNDVKHHLYAEPVEMSSRRLFHHEKERLRALGFDLRRAAALAASNARRFYDMLRAEGHRVRCTPTAEGLLAFNRSRP